MGTTADRRVATRAELLSRANVRPQMQAWRDGRVTLNGVARYFNESCAKAALEFDPEPRYTELPPRTNTGAVWMIVLGAWTAIGSLGSIPLVTVADPIALILGALLGLALLFAGAYKWQSREAYQGLVQSTRRADEVRWDQQVQMQAHAAEEMLWSWLSDALAKSIGVPVRLRTEFAAELRTNRGKRRGEWRADWWASQPEYPPAPNAVTVRHAHHEYEAFCAKWMQSIGWASAHTTRYSRDGGVDVVSDEYLVQCKHFEGGYVGAREVREIFGVATVAEKKAAVITSGRFTTDAKEFAKQAGIALVHLDERTVTPRGENTAARAFLAGPA